MKQIFGVKLAGSFTRSKRWIAANHKSDVHGRDNNVRFVPQEHCG
jgi:hypothetical protein